jgi:hypothetical protein
MFEVSAAVLAAGVYGCSGSANLCCTLQSTCISAEHGFSKQLDMRPDSTWHCECS